MQYDYTKKVVSCQLLVIRGRTKRLLFHVSCFMFYTVYMKLFSIFPDLLSWALIAPVLFRIIITLYAWKVVKMLWQSEKTRMTILFIASLFLLVGAFTQVAGLVSALLFLSLLPKAKAGTLSGINQRELLLATTLSLSFLILGAGFWAFDWPL